MTKQKQSERDEAIARLRETLKPGDTVFTVLRSVSRSGMNRKIDLYKIEDGSPQWLSRLAAKACDWTFDNKRDAVSVGGCGMDMGFHLVYSLSRVLFPDGFAPSDIGIRNHVDGKSVNVNVGRGRNAGPMRREEIAELVTKGWTFPHGRNGNASGWDEDGGYALKHRWL